MFDVVIIGAGAVGSFLARALSRYEGKFLLLEKNLDVGDVTSMANSAICHSGYDPLPGTKKALFNVIGNQMIQKIASDLDIPYKQIGTLTIGYSEDDYQKLLGLKNRARLNGVPAKLLDKEELFSLEPRISKEACCALLCPTGGIINPFLMVVHAAENAVDNGVELHLDEAVIGLSYERDIYKVKTSKGEYEARCVVNAAGLRADDIAALLTPPSWSIRPRKGVYYVLDHFDDHFVDHVLFPLPSSKGKGTVVTPTTSGNYLVGPTSDFIDDKEDFTTDAESLRKAKMDAMRLIPSLPFAEAIRTYAGLRAVPSTGDFIVEEEKNYPGMIHLAGIESPGLISSPAIAEYAIRHFLNKRLSLKEKENWNPKIRPYVHPLKMEKDARDTFLALHPEYGEMVCACEKVSKGEILDVLSRSIPCQTVRAVKKRTRAGFGKCQGGFCQVKVVQLLAEHLHISPSEVLYSGIGSYIAPYQVAKGTHHEG